MNQTANYFFKFASYLSLSYFIYLMILITWQYVPINFEVAFLNLKQEEIVFTHYQIAFFSHVYSSIFVLIIGAFQFSKTIRNRFSSLHRNLGKIYILLILAIASPSGLVMAYHANGGFFSKVSFSIQAVLWFYFTWKAYQFAKNKDWKNHQNFMMRSFALTLSAISLRLLKWVIVATLAPPPMDTYKAVAWLGWMLNLAIVEVYIWKKIELEK
ncbi:MAG: DUF2306 domain-containing protein [Saprospiraceae bacterium]